MNSFPVLSTGALAQYPLESVFSFPIRVLQFAGGGEQRFSHQKAAVKSWVLHLSKLSASERAAMESFCIAQRGHGTFSFTDPHDGAEYTCRLGEDAVRWVHRADNYADGVLVITSA